MYEKKKFKRTLSSLFGERRKVQVTKFAFEDFIFVVGSATNYVGTTPKFAAFCSGPDAKYSRASAFNHGLCGGPSTFSQKKTSMFMSIAILSREKKLFIIPLAASLALRYGKVLPVD